MNELALFAGAGGGLLASRILGHRVVCAVEKDAYCREVLMERQENGILESCPIWDDVRTFDCAPWRGRVDIVSAGFPCQPFSAAGSRRGADDERNMWPDTIRIIREVGSRWVFLENVPGLISSGYFGQILEDLAEAGFDVAWRCISAAEVGAPHRRNRLWMLGRRVSDAARSNGRWKLPQWGSTERDPDPLRDGSAGNVADAHRSTVEGDGQAREQESDLRRPDKTTQGGQPIVPGWGCWATEPDVGRVVDGVAARVDRVDRLRALGNGQVPLCAAFAFRVLARDISSRDCASVED